MDTTPGTATTTPTDGAGATAPRRRRRPLGLATALLAGAAGVAQGQVVRFEQAGYTVAESPGGELEYCLVRSGSLAGQTRVFIATRDGTATGSGPGRDFAAFAAQSTTFLPGENRTCDPVLIFDDGAAEGDEMFTLRIAGIEGPGQAGSPGEATVTILDDDAPSPGATLRMDDGGHQWGADPVVPYELTVRNTGPALPEAFLTEVVPNASVFVAGRSTPGWSCDPGPGAGSRCTFPLGGLEAGDHRVVTFAVRVLEGTPEGFELYNEAALEIPDRGANAASRVRRIVAEWGQRCRDNPEQSVTSTACVTSFGGQACTCLFGICD